MTKVENWLYTSDLPQSQRTILQVIVNYADQEITGSSFSIYTALSPKVINTQLKFLQTKGIVWVDDKINFTFEDNTYSLKVIDFIIEKPLVRKALTSTDLAKARLQSMKPTGFSAEDQEIYDLSKLYDSIYLKYSGKTQRSLPPVASLAKRSKSWTIFKKFLEYLKKNNYPSEKYIEVQFRKIRDYKRSEFLWPYPNQLYSTWAKQNFMWYIQNSVEEGDLDRIKTSESEVIKEALWSSCSSVKKMQSLWPDYPEIAVILTIIDTLSPVYLATNLSYLKFMNESENDIPSEVAEVLNRFEKDKSFKQVVVNILKEVKSEVK